jgi:hypothetical protein
MNRKMLFLTLLCVAVISSSATAATVAYWRFEEGVAGTNVPKGGTADGQYYPAVLDSSGNNYHLSAWSEGGYAGEGYRSLVPISQVPQTGAANTLSLQSTGGVPGMWTEPGSGIQTWKPLTWTVEAYFRTTDLDDWRVVVGRDGDDINAEHPAFRIMNTGDGGNAIRAAFCDMAGNVHVLNTSNGFVQLGQWYHVAATSDGTNFVLYVNGVEEARLVINSVDARLSDGSNGNAAGGGDWAPGNWTVFRGMWNGGHSDRWYGYIDEVRISDAALAPSEFLNSGAVLEGPSDWAVFPEDVTTASFTVTAAAVPFGETMTGVTWYKDTPDPNTPIVVDGVKYSVATTATQSTLTIYDVVAADQTDYSARATFSDATVVESTRKGHLYIRSGLVHRYSFDGNVNDPVGGADGIIIDPNAITDPRISFAGGQMLLDNYELNTNPADVNLIAYVELPAGIISALDNYMTIEVWLTPHRNNAWTTIFAFGDTWNPNPWIDGFTGGRVGVLAQLNRGGNGGPSFTGIAPGGGQVNMSSPDLLTLNEEVMFTATWNGNTGQMRQYVNGVLTDTDNLNARLSDMEDIKNWIGIGFWPDAILNASLNEFRIYDTALPSYYINAHYIAGPDVTAVELKPVVEAPANIAVYPNLRDDDADVSEMVAAVVDKPAGTTVAGAVWFKDPDPTISGDESQLSNGGKYSISFTDEDTTLTINNVDSLDEAYYYATVTLNTNATGTSDSGKLTVSQGLVHRWSFSGNLVDSIGGADGTLVDPSGLASFVEGTKLLLDNPGFGPNSNPAGVTYVTLPDGIVSALDNYATIEMWVTPHVKQGNQGDWVNMFAFGSDRDGDPANYTGGDGIIGSLKGDGADNPLFSWDLSGTQRWKISGPAVLDEEMLFAMVWDGNAGVGTLYVIDAAGTRVASADIGGTNRVLSNIEDTANILGGNWWNDYMLNGTINEMRIYDWPFEQPWIEEHYIVGADETVVDPCLEYSPFDVTGGAGLGEERDCKVDILDFAKFAEAWLSCGRLESCD